jgi:beta-galactosidase
LAPYLGARVEQFYALIADVPLSGSLGVGKATVWAEYLDHLAKDTEVTMRYGSGNGWLEGQPASVRRHLGQGTIAYFGAVVDSGLMASAAQQWIAESGVALHSFQVAPGVSVSRRVGMGHEVFVITNFSTGPQEISLPAKMSDVLGSGEIGRVSLPRYGVAVLDHSTR